jgi:poly(3-hydroxyalkanoate) synthetase
VQVDLELLRRFRLAPAMSAPSAARRRLITAPIPRLLRHGPPDRGEHKEMMLIRSGHIQSVVYPADGSHYDRWSGAPTPTDPDEWLASATVEKGSWWRPWTEWLIARSGHEKAARMTLGNRQYPPLADVFE